MTVLDREGLLLTFCSTEAVRFAKNKQIALFIVRIWQQKALTGPAVLDVIS